MRTILLILLLLSPAALAQNVMTPEKVADLKMVTEIATSPDGALTAYVLRNPRDMTAKEFENGPAFTELHIVDRQGWSKGYVVGDESVGKISWHPDGKEILFLAKKGKDDKPALYSIPVDGGEARQLLKFSEGISSYDMAANGQIAFIATEPKDKKKEKLEKKGFDAEVVEEQWRFAKVYLAHAEQDTKDLEPLKLDGSASVVKFAPDGKRLAVALAPTPSVDDDLMMRRVNIVATNGTVLRNLENPGKLGQFEWSPDGTHLAMVSGATINDPAEGRLMVVPVQGGTLTDLVPNYLGHVSHFDWKNADTLRFIGDEGAETVVYEVSRNGGNRRTVIPKGAGIWLSLDGDSLIGETPQHPAEVYLMQKRLTNSNPWLKNIPLAKQEVVGYTARDGLQLEGILIHPLNETPGQRYPFILMVHGGPESHYRNGWLTYYATPGQVAAAKDYAVFYPNYRGSTGRGVEFSMTSQGDAAGKEFDDLVDAVDHFIATGLAAKDKVGITGGSYGGYASAWGATYYSDRFAAAVMFVGISDKISKFGTTDIPNEEFLVHARTYPWKKWDFYAERSPLRHVEKAQTPILILHGKDDPRVHPTQSMELYRYLKALGKVPVRLVMYPGEGHGNRKEAARYDYNLRMMRWFDHYLKGPGGEKPPADVDYGLPVNES